MNACKGSGFGSSTSHSELALSNVPVFEKDIHIHECYLGTSKSIVSFGRFKVCLSTHELHYTTICWH